MNHEFNKNVDQVHVIGYWYPYEHYGLLNNLPLLRGFGGSRISQTGSASAKAMLFSQLSPKNETEKKWDETGAPRPLHLPNHNFMTLTF